MLHVRPTPVYYRGMISSAQCRAARALLGITQATLAARARVSVPVIKRFERGSDPRASTVDAIERALVAAGAAFIQDDDENSPTGLGAGVRLTARRPRRENKEPK